MWVRRSAEKVDGLVDMTELKRQTMVDVDGDAGGAKAVEEIAILAGYLLAVPLLLEQREERLACRLRRGSQPVEHPHVDEAQAQPERFHLLKCRFIAGRVQQLSVRNR